MQFLQQGKTNWKYLSIVIILSVFVLVGILAYKSKVFQSLGGLADIFGKREATVKLGELKNGDNFLAGINLRKVAPVKIDGYLAYDEDDVKLYEFSVGNYGKLALQTFEQEDGALRCTWLLEGGSIKREDDCKMFRDISPIKTPYVVYFSYGGKNYLVLPGFDFGAHELYYIFSFFQLNETGAFPLKDEREKDFSMQVNIRGIEEKGGFEAFILLGYSDNVYVFFPQVERVGFSCLCGGTGVVAFSSESFLGNVQPMSCQKEEDFALLGISELVVKKNSLYAKSENDYCFNLVPKGSFSCADSITVSCVDAYYLLKNGKIERANTEFKTVFEGNISRLDVILKDESAWREFPQYGGKDWLSPLIERTLNYISLGNSQKGWEVFTRDFERLSLAYPLPQIGSEAFATSEEIKEGIEKQLNAL